MDVLLHGGDEDGELTVGFGGMDSCVSLLTFLWRAGAEA